MSNLHNVKKTAFISPCQTYRYILTREWDPSLEKLCFLMLNPSKADHKIDDPTIKRCIYFASQAHDAECNKLYGGIVVINLFAYRATDPDELRQFWDIAVGPLNERTIQKVVTGRPVVCAWGSRGTMGFRAERVWPTIKEHAREIYCLGRTQGGQPRHPLYLPNASKFQLYDYPRRTS